MIVAAILKLIRISAFFARGDLGVFTCSQEKRALPGSEVETLHKGLVHELTSRRFKRKLENGTFQRTEKHAW
jgi:hypothetical protein